MTLMTHWDDGDWTDVPATVPTTPQPTVIVPVVGDDDTPDVPDGDIGATEPPVEDDGSTIEETEP